MNDITYFSNCIIIVPRFGSTLYVNFFYIIAAILVLGWAVGYFGFHLGNGIHLLAVVVMIAVLVNIIREGNT